MGVTIKRLHPKKATPQKGYFKKATPQKGYTQKGYTPKRLHLKKASSIKRLLFFFFILSYYYIFYSFSQIISNYYLGEMKSIYYSKLQYIFTFISTSVEPGVGVIGRVSTGSNFTTVDIYIHIW